VMEIIELHSWLEDEWRANNDGEDLPMLDYARAVLARWGTPAIQPVPVSERWPEFSDCNPFEAVWAFNPVLDHWKLTRINQTIHTHWLPHWALPMPAIAAEALPND